MKLTRSVFAFLMAGLSAGCAIHHVTPYVPDATNAPQTEDAVQASANCFEASTAAEIAICGNKSLDAPNRAMLQALQSGLRASSAEAGALFGRDALLASQRAWLLSLPASCHLDTQGAGVAACLAAALNARAAELRSAERSTHAQGAIAQYVALRPSAGAAPQPDPALCSLLAERATTALRQTGSLDPAAMGAEEVAGTHGPETGADPRHHVAVELYDANAYALYQRRARSVSLDGAPPVITPISLTGLVEARSAGNLGGRFSAYASQTGDYGSIDVFRLNGRLLVLAADPWGSTTPAAPGEAAHAGVWDISGAAAAPSCLFDTYTRPAEPGGFDALPDFTQWRAALTQIRDSANSAIGNAATRDQVQLAADTDFVLLHMPLLAVQQAASGNWTAWLRHRHDAVLDALFAWGQSIAANKPVFDQVFARLRPVATELVRTYQTTQGLTAQEATQAAGLAVMELLYQSTVTIAPGLGADLAAPASAAGTRPRYPILASPQ